jgi:chemotaxis protein MotB
LKPRYLEQESSHRDRWTVSYLDVITILLIFFVAAAAKTMTPPPPPPPAPVVEKPPAKPPLTDVEETLRKDHLDVHREPRGLVISLPQSILFPSGDDRISDSALPTVEQIVAVIRELPNPVTLIGHADSSPIHNKRFRSNWDLSAARSLRLLELLTDRYQIEESRLSISSEGANHPRESNDTPDGRASNRRVEIVIQANFSAAPVGDSAR